MVVSSRERILDVAMELFGRQGVKGTSVAQIEAAAGLSPGSGGIYYYFRSKDALLEAGIARHLARLDALRDIQQILYGIGDLRAELTVLARYSLAELDRESDLLGIVLAEARARPELVSNAVNQLISATYAGFTAWLQQRADLEPRHAEEVSAVALGSLLSSRLLNLVLGENPAGIDDQRFIKTWVEMVHAQISAS